MHGTESRNKSNSNVKNLQPKPWTKRLSSSLTLALTLTALAGCETTKRVPVAAPLPIPVKAPPLPAVAESLKPQGYYLAEHCKLEALVRLELKLTTPLPEACSSGGR